MFEYKVVPAPVKGVKAKGVKTPEARFALAIEQAINALAKEGWEYQRTDVLPSEERQGLTGTATHWRTLMVFRRSLAAPGAVETGTDAPRGRVEPVLRATPAVAAVSSAVPEGGGVADSSEAKSREAEPEFEEGNEETRPA